ncbi:MAG: hypothetical protein PHQ86_07835 [Dehalococcoidales bacterium]|nr:hypothetical protein [Dehalococcoidales bacterium]
MSCDSTDDEIHLTPNGWVYGTHFFYGEADEKIPRPPNAIETWVRKMRQSYSMAPEHITWECTWVSPNYSEAERLAINKKYPRPNQ